jgi:hypothetical protein
MHMARLACEAHFAHMGSALRLNRRATNFMAGIWFSSRLRINKVEIKYMFTISTELSVAAIMAQVQISSLSHSSSAIFSLRLQNHGRA